MLDFLFTSPFWFSVFAVTLGGIIRGFIGAGSGLIMIPLMSLVYWPPQALTIAIMIGVVGSIQMIPQTLQYVQWRQVFPLIGASVISIPLGTALLFLVDPSTSRRAIGLIVLFASLILISGWTYSGPRNSYVGLVAGASAGILNGFAGAGSLIPTLYFVASTEEARILRANIFTVVSLFLVITTVALAFRGTVTSESIRIASALLIPYVASMWVGSKMFHLASDKLFRHLALWTLALVGAFVAIV